MFDDMVLKGTILWVPRNSCTRAILDGTSMHYEDFIEITSIVQLNGGYPGLH
jgi:hypothetical protein